MGYVWVHADLVTNWVQLGIYIDAPKSVEWPRTLILYRWRISKNLHMYNHGIHGQIHATLHCNYVHNKTVNSQVWTTATMCVYMHRGVVSIHKLNIGTCSWFCPTPTCTLHVFAEALCNFNQYAVASLTYWQVQGSKYSAFDRPLGDLQDILRMLISGWCKYCFYFKGWHWRDSSGESPRVCSPREDGEPDIKGEETICWRPSSW